MQKRANLDLQNAVDDNEQYVRQLCLQLDRVPVLEKKSSYMVLGNAKNIFEDAVIEISDTVIDRADRIGKGFLTPWCSG